MNNYRITEDLLTKFKNYMIKSEKAPATIEKYLRDIGALFDEIGSVELTKEYMVSYKARLRENYKCESRVEITVKKRSSKATKDMSKKPLS